MLTIFPLPGKRILKQDSIDSVTKVNHRNINEIDFNSFFIDENYKTVKFPNVQIFDEEGFLGRAFFILLCTGRRYRSRRKIQEIIKRYFREV